MPTPRVFGDDITRERGISLYKLAQDLKISLDQLSRFRLGKSVPTLPTARLIARGLAIPLDDLLFPGEARVDGRKTRKRVSKAPKPTESV